VFGYLGPNGAGKTTTIRLVAGLLRPTTGRVEVLGMELARHRDEVQRRLGYLPGLFVAYPDLTVGQYLHYLASLRGGVDADHVAALLRRFDVEEGRRIGTLSHGNQQKVGIVQAFMHRPDLLVLDEPTSGLDPIMQQRFLDLVRETCATGATVFLSSHALSEVETIADTVAILRAGELVTTASVSDLRAQVVRRWDLTFATVVPERVLRACRGVAELTVDGRTAHLAVTGSAEHLLRAAAPYGVENVTTHEADLAQVFLRYYEAEPCPA
jgi:ABC-2 type transport system ATP-binding protein